MLIAPPDFLRALSQHTVSHAGDNDVHVGLLLLLGVGGEGVAHIGAQLAGQVNAAVLGLPVLWPVTQQRGRVRKPGHRLSLSICRGISQESLRQGMMAGSHRMTACFYASIKFNVPHTNGGHEKN